MYIPGPALYALQHDPHFKEHGTTLDMFLRYVVDTYKDRSNLHWRAVGDICFPCAMPFDYVGKLEDKRTKDTLMTFLYKDKALLGKLTFPTDHKSHKNSSSILKRAYASVSNDTLKGIKRIFKNDFILFGYSMDID